MFIPFHTWLYVVSFLTNTLYIGCHQYYFDSHLIGKYKINIFEIFILFYQVKMAKEEKQQQWQQQQLRDASYREVFTRIDILRQTKKVRYDGILVSNNLLWAWVIRVISVNTDMACQTQWQVPVPWGQANNRPSLRWWLSLLGIGLSVCFAKVAACWCKQVHGLLHFCEIASVTWSVIMWSLQVCLHDFCLGLV